MRNVVSLDAWKSRGVLAMSDVTVVGGRLYWGSDFFRAPWMDYFAEEVETIRRKSTYGRFTVLSEEFMRREKPR